MSRANDQMRMPKSANALQDLYEKFEVELKNGLRVRAQKTMQEVLEELGVRSNQLEIRTKANLEKVQSVIDKKAPKSSIPPTEGIREIGEKIKVLGENWINAANQAEKILKK